MKQWKGIPGYEGMYQVSDQGDIRSLDRYDCRGRFRKGRPMVPLKHSHGYRAIHLSHDGKSDTLKIHRAVASAFLPDYDNDKQVDHINGVRNDNRLENLRMATNSENKANMRKIEGCSSKYKGVCRHKATGKWTAAIKYNGTGVHIGLFETEEKAALAYDARIVEYFGEYAATNKKLGLL